VLWGLAYLFLPGGNSAFLVRHWSEAKKGFMISLLGAGVCAAAIATSGDMRENFAKDLQARFGHGSSKGGEMDLTAQIAAQREMITELESDFNQTSGELTKRHQALAATRKALKPGDTEAITRYNKEAADYQEEVNDLKEDLKEIAGARQELDAMLAERSKKAAEAAAKHVVMYTTAQCPACQQAKKYFAQRGVNYEERNVEQSRQAAEEFQKLGGHGVPLIMVGNNRMEGFSPQALDKML
jgi:glutaredoxin-like YruB-family protein